MHKSGHENDGQILYEIIKILNDFKLEVLCHLKHSPFYFIMRNGIELPKF